MEWEINHFHVTVGHFNQFPVNTDTFHGAGPSAKDFFEVLCLLVVLMEGIIFLLCGELDRLAHIQDYINSP